MTADLALVPYAVVDPLAQLERAAELLAEARTAFDIPSKIMPVIAIAEAFRVYARQAELGLVAQNHAAAIKLRAEHKAGELLSDMPKSGGAKGTGSNQYEVRSQPETAPRYEDLGIDKSQAHRWQQVARLPSATLEAYIDQSNADGQEVTSAGARAIAAVFDKAERAQPPIPRPNSVIETDQEALSVLLTLHAVADPRILDVTHNHGRMWQGLPYQPHRLDADPGLRALGFTDTVADFRALPFEPSSWDVLVFDPPHITDAGRDGLVGEREGEGWGGRYGTLSEGFTGPSIAPIFPGFLAEARRVLVPGTGVILAKIADQVHGGAYRWHHVELITAAQAAGFTACDCMIKVSLSRSGLIDPRWKHIYHVRSVHTYWMAFRNGTGCMRSAA